MSETDNTIIRLAGRGDGVTGDGRYVAFAAPGDRVTDDGSIIAGPHHQSPPCRHFPRCGGCQMQHVDDDAYADFLTDRVASALAAQKLAIPDILPPHLSPPRTRRRATMKAMRLGGSVLVGFNEGRSHKLIDLRQCEILDPALFALVAPLRKLMATLLGRRGIATIQLTLADQGPDVLISGVEAEGLTAHDALFDFATQNGLARLALDEGNGPEDRWIPEPVTITLGGVPVPMPHAPFLQATREGEQALVDAVREIVGTATPVADLFAGLGTFAFALAGQGPVTAVEAARDPILSLRRAANLRLLPVTCDHRDLYRRPLTAQELALFGAVVLDPPRAGAEEQVKALAASNVPVIAYVSCNPQSFARDTAILIAGGYKIDWVKPVGQFRWSTHAELVAQISR
jgi:23S rRNA (uracil1939-C5)-methyltransferase